MDKYKLQTIIGDGTYGSVWRGISLETNETVAIKKLKNKVKSWEECLQMKEIKALSKLKSHENIIKLKEVVRENTGEVCLIFEYAENNLFSFIESYRNSNKNIPEEKIKEIVFQIANGLSHAHSKGYFHRDLKPENILFVKGVVKIADFGLATELPNYYNNPALTEYVCTRWYRAPECILGSKAYSWMIDVWSLGCIMCELYLLRPIFPGDSKFDQMDKIIQVLGTPNFNDWPDGYRLLQNLNMKFLIAEKCLLGEIIKNASESAILLLNDILNFDPLRRPNCMKIVKHFYFSNLNGMNTIDKNYDYYNNNNFHHQQFQNNNELSNYFGFSKGENNNNNNYSNNNIFSKNIYNNNHLVPEKSYHSNNFDINIGKNIDHQFSNNKEKSQFFSINSGANFLNSNANFNQRAKSNINNENSENLSCKTNLINNTLFQNSSNNIINPKSDVNLKNKFFQNEAYFKNTYDNRSINNNFASNVNNAYEKLIINNKNTSKISNYAENHFFTFGKQTKNNNPILQDYNNHYINNTWNSGRNKNDLNSNINLEIKNFKNFSDNNSFFNNENYNKYKNDYRYI